MATRGDITKRSTEHVCPGCGRYVSYQQCMREDKIYKGQILHFIQCCYCGNNLKIAESGWVKGIEVTDMPKPIKKEVKKEVKTVVSEDEPKRGRGRPKGK